MNNENFKDFIQENDFQDLKVICVINILNNNN